MTVPLENLQGGGVLALAPAKVNLFLEILGLRPDGYHEIDTIMQEITLWDEIEFRRGGSCSPGGIHLEIVDGDGLPSALKPADDNLVLRAARLFFEAVGGNPFTESLEIRLVKRIPMGAGLGGGSSDGALTLLALARLSGIDPGMPELERLAARLGSDVAFFIHGGTARCRGRGEQITPLGDVLGPEPLHLVLVHPPIHVSTSLIYRELDRQAGGGVGLTRHPGPDTISPDRLGSALRSGRLLFNRLEGIACSAFPALEAYKKEIQNEPFVATLMSGSGSTFYGIARSHGEAEEIAARLRQRIRGEVFVAQSAGGEQRPCGGSPF